MFVADATQGQYTTRYGTVVTISLL